MRSLTELADGSAAERLRDILDGDGISCEVAPGRAGTWIVWVHDERRLVDAQALERAFARDPTDPTLEALASRARARRRIVAAEAASSRHRVVDVRTRWRAQGASGTGRLTLGLIVLCVLAAIATGLGDRAEVVDWLTIAGFRTTADLVHLRVSPWHDVLAGEVWRLFTPALVHFGFLHILFNMLWLRDLGGMVERAHSARFLAAFVLVAAGLSNALQFAVTGHPMFGGMSGVVYGLLGYVWIRGRFDPSSGLFVSPTTVVWMLVWFAAGFLAPSLRVANGAHAGGLLVGAAWGFTAARLLPRRRRRRR